MFVCVHTGQGLITGRTSAYLVDPKRADIRSKQNIADTQSHEVVLVSKRFNQLNIISGCPYVYVSPDSL